MISRNLLQQAADQNIIENRQIDPLFNFLTHQETASDSDDQNREEPLKFIRSFGDIFITLGVILLVIAINMTELSGYYYFIPAAGFVLVAEWLVRVRRLALPGIAILLSILYFVNKAIAFDHENATVFGLGVLSLTSLVFYLRYKMPFSLLPLAASLVAITIIQIGLDVLAHPIIFVGLGLVVFIVAMIFDVIDTRRLSHYSDSAFFLLALLIDRRALLISTQLYAIYALTQLLQGQLSSAQNILMYVMMALGLFVIFFGTYWYLARRLIFGFLLGTAFSRYIPDLNMTDTKR